MRLIDADELKELILAERDKIPKKVPCATYELMREKDNKHGNAMRGGIRVALRCMENTPTIEAEPVRHAKYDAAGDCTNCGFPIPTDDRIDAIFEEEIRYCYHCGSKMDGGADGQTG